MSSSGGPHISYYDGRSLQHAWQDGADWRNEIVDSGGPVGDHTSLALDSLDRPRVSYLDAANADLRYAHYDSLGWQAETVDSTGGVGFYTSLALDAAGHPHISYYGDVGGAGLRYARYDGSAWHVEVVDDAGSVGPHTSLALDAADRPHVSYYDATNRDLKYAYYDGQGWYTETVDSTGDSVGWYTSLALDAAGWPHISYYDAYSQNVKYAHHDGSAWQIETVSSMQGAGTSLALDASGRPHISYPDGDLRYAHHDGLGWQIEVVDIGSGGVVGEYSSLALDADGRPHIGYWGYSAAGAELRYAYHDGTVWQIEVVDSRLGSYSHHTSLALDGDGYPHISYYDEINGDPKYAHLCKHVEQVTVDGPAVLPAGIAGLYTAVYTPITATLPVTLTWDSGFVGPTAAYSWTLTGTYALAVTATNPCSEVVDVFSVTVFCQQIEGVEVEGPSALLVGQAGIYRAVAQPITTSPPITFTWDNGTVGPMATYSWPATGTYTLTVTGTNRCGTAQGGLQVQVLAEWPYHQYLPLVRKQD